ncbi:glucose-6-phosphate translocase [Platysternon megacephalum]|uniref:Glucose-6-phosphate translocase n=1 Tax=Platysternon megacephalum TaxID=55544 RepID=A0A4D9DQ92_9SAUR|nr:glucose-6-phosphate translocase [Platysternon megacephalum]
MCTNPTPPYTELGYQSERLGEERPLLNHFLHPARFSSLGSHHGIGQARPPACLPHESQWDHWLAVHEASVMPRSEWLEFAGGVTQSLTSGDTWERLCFLALTERVSVPSWLISQWSPCPQPLQCAFESNETSCSWASAPPAKELWEAQRGGEAP